MAWYAVRLNLANFPHQLSTHACIIPNCYIPISATTSVHNNYHAGISIGIANISNMKNHVGLIQLLQHQTRGVECSLLIMYGLLAAIELASAHICMADVGKNERNLLAV